MTEHVKSIRASVWLLALGFGLGLAFLSGGCWYIAQYRTCGHSFWLTLSSIVMTLFGGRVTYLAMVNLRHRPYVEYDGETLRCMRNGQLSVISVADIAEIIASISGQPDGAVASYSVVMRDGKVHQMPYLPGLPGFIGYVSATGREGGIPVVAGMTGVDGWIVLTGAVIGLQAFVLDKRL